MFLSSAAALVAARGGMAHGARSRIIDNLLPPGVHMAGGNQDPKVKFQSPLGRHFRSNSLRFRPQEPHSRLKSIVPRSSSAVPSQNPMVDPQFSEYDLGCECVDNKGIQRVLPVTGF